MPIKIKHLGESVPHLRQLIHSLLMGIYLDGECYALAIALHRGLDWSMVGLMTGEVVRHVVVRRPGSDEFYDARGLIDPDELGQPFDLKLVALKPVSVEELMNIRPVNEQSIERARQMAEVLWPELPWKNPQIDRITAFASELEALCRRHGIWVTGTIPTDQPRLVQGDGSEADYIIEVGPNGIFTITLRYSEQE